MSRTLLAVPFLLLLACGPSGKPEDATYASELGVDLSAMEKRDGGVYVQDLVVGTGPEVHSGTRVTVHYTGWLTDGWQFDSSLAEGRSPYSFLLGLGNVIDGWDVGVEGMRVGGKRKLVIPSEMAYGSDGYASIPGNAVLVFDVEVLFIGGAQ
ncbi:MAG: FKBP-type peptidyl-prolyl cis-trans isomerase [Myxococcaceae bacterium]|nr:FKBP-type peptidyl-prolyl cis-trans isomerase [Myxococcaceae bacterium]